MRKFYASFITLASLTGALWFSVVSPSNASKWCVRDSNGSYSEPFYTSDGFSGVAKVFNSESQIKLCKTVDSFRI